MRVNGVHYLCAYLCARVLLDPVPTAEDAESKRASEPRARRSRRLCKRRQRPNAPPSGGGCAGTRMAASSNEGTSQRLPERSIGRFWNARAPSGATAGPTISGSGGERAFWSGLRGRFAALQVDGRRRQAIPPNRGAPAASLNGKIPAARSVLRGNQHLRFAGPSADDCAAGVGVAMGRRRAIQGRPRRQIRPLPRQGAIRHRRTA